MDANVNSVDNKYYMVHNPKDRFPQHKHDDYTKARTEATRLAKANVGSTFIILEAKESYRVDIPEPTVTKL